MYNIDWLYIIKVLIPPVIRKEKLIALLRSLLRPMIWNWSQFLDYRDDTLYYTGITFQKIAMEKMLNDIYDSIQRRIEIVDEGQVDRIYWANKSLGYPKRWIANKWSSTEANSVDDVRRYDTKLYKCIQAGTGQQPDITPLYWEELQNADFIGDKAYSGLGYDFVIEVPEDIYTSVNLDEMTALVDQYKFGSKRFIIQSI
jgi:hypothetical protein